MTQRFRQWGLGLAFLGAVFLTSPLACSADNIAAAEQPTSLSSVDDEAFQALREADVVYLGEQHNSVDDHAAQLEIIKGLYAENPDIAIAMEMFQRPFQPVIDRYLAGEISEVELVEQTQYLERWGFPWELYAPFLRFAQENQLPVLAANTPDEIRRQISREGLDSLEGDDFRYIPPLDEIDTSNADYREFFAAAFSGHSSHSNLNFENSFAVQITWDETMAMTVADFKADNPDTQIVVLAGSGHVIFGYGIPDRVERRLGDDLIQQIVLLNPIEGLAEMGGAIADMFWYSE